MISCSTDIENDFHYENGEDTNAGLLLKEGRNLPKNKHNFLKNGFKISLMNKNGYEYKNIHSKSNEDLRSQSLFESKDVDININSKNNNCDTESKLLSYQCSPPSSPTSESWFKTWPERCDKTKSAESSPEHSKTCRVKDISNTQNKKSCDNIVDNTVFKNTLTFSEALQNISLAYSPVTRQLHLVESTTENLEQIKNPNHKNEENCKDQETDKLTVEYCDLRHIKKQGHKRTEAGSFSSTISTLSGLSDPSTCGSLLDADDRSLTSFEDYDSKPRKKSLTNFFTRNVFPWKSGNDLNSSTNSVWKFFSKNSSESSSPLHVVASSSALIQHKRPSNLPAKTLEEEQRHREEYNEILAAAKKKEAKHSAAKQKLQKLQLQQEEQQASAAKHFIHQVLPKWEIMQKNKKTQELWWNGLPSSVRGKVWRLAIGNELNVTPQLYEICLLRAQTRLNSPEPSHCESDADQESSMDVIQLDISRTFPNLCIFQQGGPYSDVLHSLLAAYVCFRPDVGYVQGMSYIAAILILNMEPYDAFICFANLLNQPLHLSAFTLNQTQMLSYYNAYNEVFSYNLPKLYSHFENSGLTPDLYLLDWIYTVFAKAMPLDIACRVWDIFLRDGYEFIFRTALGILHLYQSTLISMDFLHGAQFLTRLPEDMSSDQLFRSIQLVTTSIGKHSFSQIVERCSISQSDSFR